MIHVSAIQRRRQSSGEKLQVEAAVRYNVAVGEDKGPVLLSRPFEDNPHMELVGSLNHDATKL